MPVPPSSWEGNAPEKSNIGFTKRNKKIEEMQGAEKVFVCILGRETNATIERATNTMNTPAAKPKEK
jgi:hypothetical protein